MGARGRERDAVCKGDTEGGKSVRERKVVRVVVGVDGDVGDPAQRQPGDGFDEGRHVPDRVRETAREEVVVAHIKARRTRQCDCVRGHEIRRPERADVPRRRRTRRIEDELLDGRVCARVIDDEEVGRRSVVGRVDLHAERVKVVAGGVPLEREAVDGVGAGGVEKEVTARVGISKGTHDGVPGFPVGITAEEHEAVREYAVGVVMIPKGDVLAKVDVIGGGVFDEGTVGGPVAANVVGVWEVWGGEDVVPGNAATAVDEDSLGVGWVRCELG